MYHPTDFWKVPQPQDHLLEESFQMTDKLDKEYIKLLQTQLAMFSAENKLLQQGLVTQEMIAKNALLVAYIAIVSNQD